MANDFGGNESGEIAIPPLEHLSVDGMQIAVRHRPGNEPGIFWLGGYRSNMLGTKACALDSWAAKRGLAFTRHDYSGHGESAGLYHEGNISKWLAQSMAVFRRYAMSKNILVGSSLGGWIALRMVQELNKLKTIGGANKEQQQANNLSGVLLLAPAPDFTTELMEPALSDDDRKQLSTRGFYEEKTEWMEEPNIWRQECFDDARLNLVLTAPLQSGCPVHIVHGLEDKEVPRTLVEKLIRLLPPEQFSQTQIPDGDHGLSRPEDIELIKNALETLIDRGINDDARSA